MNDERTTRDSAALNDATDDVIRKMTQVQVPDDAVARVMARVRGAAAGAAGDSTAGVRQPAQGWFGALLEPRVSWGMTAAAAALAAILAVGVTLRVAGNERPGYPANIDLRGSGIGGSPVAPAPLVAAANPSQSQQDLSLRESAPQPQAPAVGHSASVQPAAARVARVHQSHGAGAAKGLGGLDQTVTAAMVATPDEEPARAAATATGSGSTADGAQEAPARTERALGPAPQNVKLDITITDQSASAKPFTKTVTMIVADREMGSIRSETRMPFLQQVKTGASNSPATIDRWESEVLPLNVDVWPTIYPDGHVRVRLKLDYRAASHPNTSPTEPMATASVTKSLIAVLNDGKPSIVSQSADAATDRKVTVELKATIQK
jgi:hypothetical protein